MELKLVQVENNADFKQFKLCDESDKKIGNFYVEVDKETALISYDTEEEFRHQGYASKGLNLVRDNLFSDDNILFLELINLTSDYSRKVAENAGFFSKSGNLDYWVLSNPRAEEIVNNRLNSLDVSSPEYKKANRLLNKARIWQEAANKAKEQLHNKLESLLQQRDLEDEDMPDNYKNYLNSEIHHLQGILPATQSVTKNVK